ncbi:DUF748 domain-containing protein [Arenicella xantha]|uniref:Uncharacterized protein DUF748 n=1 Tax=Arenicella xantha TaxID=644221 RepID=A0A395JR28_9GAMM|nr:DUF748 domain-containing protein [Arenicella xantha]RBP52782.1 uncharacterized protein DUF748 [Arenicella xantha]
MALLQSYPRSKVLLLTLLILALTTRLMLPSIVETRINRLIAQNPKVDGGINDIDLWLLSGRISINDLVLNKAGAAIPAPIFSADTVTFSVSWRDLFRGRLFGDIVVTRPVLNIVDAGRQENAQTGQEIRWRAALESAYPFEINRIYVRRGEVHFRNFSSQPPVDLYLENIEAQALNLTNELVVEDSKQAQISLSASTIGAGKVRLTSNFNLLRQPAKGELSLEVSELDVTALNDFARAYANLDFQEGTLQADLALATIEDGESFALTGKLQPKVTNLNVLRWQDDVEQQHDTPVILAWEGLVDVAKWLLEVGKQDRLTTEIELNGTLSEPDIDVLSGILGLIKNALLGVFHDEEPEKQ